MTNLTSVGVTAGVPTSGTGTVSTIDNMPNLQLTTQLGNGTNTVAIKPSSTAAQVTDPSLVTTIHPSSIGIITYGVPGTASSEVLSVQGIASATPLIDNVTQLGGNAIGVGAGATSAGTIRTTLASDSVGIIPTGTQSAPATTYLSVVSPFSYQHIATATTTTIKSGAGLLHNIVVNTGGTGSIATVYDNTAGSGTVIAIINTAAAVNCHYDVAFITGLTIVTATGTAADITVSYK